MTAGDDKEQDQIDVDEAAAFAKQFQSAVNEGGFNPFSLITGQRVFHSLFLAPFSRQLDKAREQFLADGTGSLQSLVEQFQQQGLAPDAARSQAEMMLRAAQGMLIVVCCDNQGPIILPQLFFGSLSDEFIDHAVGLCGQDFPDVDGLKACLIGLRALAERGTNWPGLVVEAQGETDVGSYWSTMGDLVLEGVDEGFFAGAGGRVTELSHWVGRAMAELQQAGRELGGDELYALTRVALAAGDTDQACRWLADLLDDYEPEDESLAVVLDELAQTAIVNDEADRALTFFDDYGADIDGVLGGLWELALPRFKLHAAAVVEEDRMLAAAEALQQADRKSFRHAMAREPLWRVGVPRSDLLDTQAAADLLDRSISFVAKRLEQGTLPFRRDDDELRIPEAALRNWQAVMQRYELLD